MRRWEIGLAIAGGVCLLLGAAWIRRGELPRRDFVLREGGYEIPVTEFDPPTDVVPAGSAIVLHGLSANRRVMTYLNEDLAGHGLRTYALDLPGHGDNKDAFTFPRAQRCATLAVEELIRIGKIDLRKTVLVGHSMGGSIAIRMTDREPVLATIAISPGPMPLPTRMPANLLVFTAQYDVAPLVKEAKDLEAAAGGEREAPQDFAQERAFDLRFIPFATHTSVLADHRVAHRAELWAMQALFPQIATETLTLNLDLATYETFNLGRRRLAGAIFGCVGLVLIFPFTASAVVRMLGIRREPDRPSATTEDKLDADLSNRWRAIGMVLLEGIICAMVGVLLLTIFVPLRFLHMYVGDYFASLLLIFGIVMLLLNRENGRAVLKFDRGTQIAAAVLGIGAILAFGGWLNWQITDGWLNAPRWLRFCILLPVIWIFVYAEEVALGPVSSGARRVARFALVIALRVVVWLACLFAYYELASGQVLIPLLLTALAMFSILQRLATDALRLRTGSATAAALFGAILGSWLIASVFPLT